MNKRNKSVRSGSSKIGVLSTTSFLSIYNNGSDSNHRSQKKNPFQSTFSLKNTLPEKYRRQRICSHCVGIRFGRVGRSRNTRGGVSGKNLTDENRANETHSKNPKAFRQIATRFQWRPASPVRSSRDGFPRQAAIIFIVFAAVCRARVGYARSTDASPGYRPLPAVYRSGSTASGLPREPRKEDVTAKTDTDDRPQSTTRARQRDVTTDGVRRTPSEKHMVPVPQACALATPSACTPARSVFIAPAPRPRRTDQESGPTEVVGGKFRAIFNPLTVLPLTFRAPQKNKKCFI